MVIDGRNALGARTSVSLEPSILRYLFASCGGDVEGRAWIRSQMRKMDKVTARTMRESIFERIVKPSLVKAVKSAKGSEIQVDIEDF